MPYTFVTVPTMTATSSCSSNLLVRDANQSSGMIYSTLTSTYSSDMDCRWTLTSNAVIELLFNSFTTELYADYLRVYDGDSTSAPLIGRFSGRWVEKALWSLLADSLVGMTRTSQAYTWKSNNNLTIFRFGSTLCGDCEQSLFFFRFSKGSARARERWAAKWDARNEGVCVSRAFCSTDQEKRETARSLPCVRN